MQKPNKNYHTSVILLISLFICVSLGILYFLFGMIADKSHTIFGPPATTLNYYQRLEFPIRLYLNQQKLVNPIDLSKKEIQFTINLGESASLISANLQNAGLISDAEIFRIYLIYAGLDTRLQAGKYTLNTGLTAIQIAQDLGKASSQDVDFVILPGWRIEEIAASLPTSGLAISPDDFVKAAYSLKPASMPDGDLPDKASLEGTLFPDRYRLARNMTLDQIISIIEENLNQKLTTKILEGFTQQGLTVYQGIILASIVQREAIITDEQPVIASVFENRLNAGMRLESDPTVQYALGYNPLQSTWWTNPLNATDLQIDSPYNTYLYNGLPPGPISNPGIDALKAVAFPASTSYYYFRARCDGSGLHNFAETLQEQIENACP
jgi:UPF0755 protein